MKPDYPWYRFVENDSLEQGDIFSACQVLEPTISRIEDGAESDIGAIAREYDVLILSQSCDLAHGKLETVLVCPYWSLQDFEAQDEFFRSGKGKEDIRRGNVPGLHMLAACDLPGFTSPVRIVSFRQVFGLPFDYVSGLARRQSPRLRLLPPYREHLAQAFARFIMRVGLPVDIPPFKK
jgi:hypothetical protein